MEASTPARSVLMIIRRFPPMMSGKGYQMLTLSPALEARNVKVTVLTINPGAAPRKEHYPGVDVVRVNANLNGSGQILFALWNLWHILSNRGKYDLVHLQSLSGLHVPFAVLAAKLTGLSAIGELSLLGSDDPLSLEKTQLGRLILRAVRQLNRIVYMSAPLKESCLRADFKPEKLAYVPNGVNLNNFHAPESSADKALLRRQLDLPPDVPVAVFVGTFFRRKGADILLDAWIEILKRHPQAILVCIGTPPQKSQPEPEVTEAWTRAEKAGALQNIRILGQRNDVNLFMRAADVLAFPSRAEGFGNVIIEAMATSLPCVIGPLDGISREIVGDDLYNQTVVDPLNTESFTERLIEHFNNAGKAKQLGQSLNERVRQKFEIGMIAIGP